MHIQASMIRRPQTHGSTPSYPQFLQLLLLSHRYSGTARAWQPDSGSGSQIAARKSKGHRHEHRASPRGMLIRFHNFFGNPAELASGLVPPPHPPTPPRLCSVTRCPMPPGQPSSNGAMLAGARPRQAASVTCWDAIRCPVLPPSPHHLF
jgi:hypothetical protein